MKGLRNYLSICFMTILAGCSTMSDKVRAPIIMGDSTQSTDILKGTKGAIGNLQTQENSGTLQEILKKLSNGSTELVVKEETEKNKADINPPSDLLNKKVFTKSFVTDIKEIKYFPAAILLLTDKWYTKREALQLCKTVEKLSPADYAKHKEEFVTYFILKKQTNNFDQYNCSAVKDMYDYDKSKEEAYKLMIPHYSDLSIVRRSIEKAKVRGPYIVIYLDSIDGKKIIVDLNKLGEESTAFFVENWERLVYEIMKSDKVSTPKEFVENALENNQELLNKLEADKKANLNLWLKGTTCVGVLATSITTAGTSGAITGLMITLGEKAVKESSTCSAILDIAKS